MDISRNIYIDPKIKKPKITLWKLKRNKRVKKLYCIVYTEKNFLEIVNSNILYKYLDKGSIIGISTSRQIAFELVEKIFQDIYIPNPSLSFMREYFTGQS